MNTRPASPEGTGGGEILIDSTRIVERLEELHPDPPLYTSAEAHLFVEWFNEVWKGPPNAIAAGDADPALWSRLASWQQLFEALLEGRDYLLGDFGAADVCAFPFIKYAVAAPDPADLDPFHAVLRELHAPPNVRAWIARVDARPRA